MPGVIDFNYQFNNKQQLDWCEEKYYFADSAKWKGFKENFGYDAVNRLDTVVGGAAGLTMTYLGNLMLSKSDVGTYAYQNGNHRIDELTTVAGYTPNEHHLTYTAEGKVDTLTEITDSTTVKKFSFGYGIDNQRFSMKYLVNDTLKYTRYYDGDYEKEVRAHGSERNISYIYANGDLVAIHIEQGADTTFFVYTDYLGSIRCITDSIGTTKQMLSFDAWGNRRDPITGILDSTISANLMFARGYTGHEHLDEVGLINMNGRVYDPGLGIFISVDNYVQQPDNTQNFNRYSYCVNNPMMYTDPDGQWFGIDDIVAMAIGGVYNLASNAIQGNIHNFGQGLGYFVAGVAAGEATLYAGPVAGGLILGGANTALQGGNAAEIIQGTVVGGLNGALTQVSPIKIPFGESGFGLNIAPQIAVGTDGFGVGLNATAGYTYKGFTAGVNLGGTYYASAAGTGASGFEGRIGYGIGYKGNHFQAGVGSTYFFSGETSQLTGQMYAGGGKWKVTYENDTWAPVPGLWRGGGWESDRFRTAALRLDITGGRLKGVNAGFNIFTGQSNGSVNWSQGPNGTFREPGNSYRMGALYVGYGNFRIGYNSERNVRGPIQNGFHNLMSYPHFEVLNISDRFYGGYYSSNPYTLW